MKQKYGGKWLAQLILNKIPAKFKVDESIHLELEIRREGAIHSLLIARIDC